MFAALAPTYVRMSTMLASLSVSLQGLALLADWLGLVCSRISMSCTGLHFTSHARVRLKTQISLRMFSSSNNKST